MPRVNEQSAGYMELPSAKKDADCRVVEVEGGISSELGCCNLFWPEGANVQAFRCGTCEYVTSKGQKLGRKEGRRLSDMEILNDDREAGEEEENE